MRICMLLDVYNRNREMMSNKRNDYFYGFMFCKFLHTGTCLVDISCNVSMYMYEPHNGTGTRPSRVISHEGVNCKKH